MDWLYQVRSLREIAGSQAAGQDQTLVREADSVLQSLVWKLIDTGISVDKADINQQDPRTLIAKSLKRFNLPAVIVETILGQRWTLPVETEVLADGWKGSIFGKTVTRTRNLRISGRRVFGPAAQEIGEYMERDEPGSNKSVTIGGIEMHDVDPNGERTLVSSGVEQLIQENGETANMLISLSQIDDQPREVASYVVYGKQGQILYRSNPHTNNDSRSVETPRSDIAWAINKFGRQNIAVIHEYHTHPTFEFAVINVKENKLGIRTSPLSPSDIESGRDHAQFGVPIITSAVLPNGYMYSYLTGAAQNDPQFIKAFSK